MSSKNVSTSHGTSNPPSTSNRGGTADFGTKGSDVPIKNKLQDYRDQIAHIKKFISGKQPKGNVLDD